MAEPNQYLRLQLQGVQYLLPSTSGFTIEQREGLLANSDPASPIVAWRAVRNSRWPAYCLDTGLKPARRDDWSRAVFIEATPHAIGLAVDDVHMLPRADTQVGPFTPLGPAPTRHGHLFAGVWVTGRRVTLVFDPKALIGYLQGLGG